MLSHSIMSNSLQPHGLQTTRLLCSWDSPGKNTEMGCHAFYQGTFPTQRSNPGLPYCRQILYRLSHQGSPRILEWVAYPFSRGSSWPRNQPQVSCIAGGFFTSWATKEAQSNYTPIKKRVFSTLKGKKCVKSKLKYLKKSLLFLIISNNYICLCK